MKLSFNALMLNLPPLEIENEIQNEYWLKADILVSKNSLAACCCFPGALPGLALACWALCKSDSACKTSLQIHEFQRSVSQEGSRVIKVFSWREGRGLETLGDKKGHTCRGRCVMCVDMIRPAGSAAAGGGLLQTAVTRDVRRLWTSEGWWQL